MKFLSNTCSTLWARLTSIHGAHGLWLVVLLLALKNPSYTWAHLYDPRSPLAVVSAGLVACIVIDVGIMVVHMARSYRLGLGMGIDYSKMWSQLDTKSAWNKASPVEPIFILRGQDQLAPFYVRMWAGAVMERANVRGEDGYKSPTSLRQLVKAKQAMSIADAMVAYQKATGRSKIPD